MPASMHISVMLNQTCSASSSVHCCPCNMNIEKKKCIIVKQKLVIEFKNIIGQYRHAWYLQTQLLEILYTFLLLLSLNILHMSAADTDMRNELQICFAWKKTARKHSEMTDSMKRQRQKETDMCTHKKKRNALYFMHFWKWNNLRVSAHVCLLLSVPFRAVYHFAVLQNQLAHKQALTAGSFPRLWHVLKEMTVREEYFTVHVIQDIMSWPHWKDTSGTLFKILC